MVQLISLSKTFIPSENVYFCWLCSLFDISFIQLFVVDASLTCSFSRYFLHPYSRWPCCQTALTSQSRWPARKSWRRPYFYQGLQVSLDLQVKHMKLKIIKYCQTLHNETGLHPVGMVWSSKHNIQLRLMGMSLVLQVFGHKPKFWTNLNFDLVMVLNKKLRDH